MVDLSVYTNHRMGNMYYSKSTAPGRSDPEASFHYYRRQRTIKGKPEKLNHAEMTKNKTKREGERAK